MDISSDSIKISYLVPVFNVPEIYLKNCLDSLVNQTYKNIEIVIVDDGSTNGSSKICDEYGQKYKNVIIIHQKNEGLSFARNVAFSNSTGEYISFVDGDDFLDKEASQKIIQELRKVKYDVILYDVYKHCGSKNSIIHSFSFPRKSFNEAECKSLQLRVLDFNGKIAQVFAKAIKRDLLERNNIYHISKCKQGAEGLVFNFQLFQFAKTALYIDIPLYNYQINPNSISHRLTEKNIFYTLLCFEQIKVLILKFGLKESAFPLFYQRMTYVIVTSAISGYFNPDNKFSYSQKKAGLNHFLQEQLVQETIRKAKYKLLPMKRKIAYFLVIHRCYAALSLLGKIRNKEWKAK